MSNFSVIIMAGGLGKRMNSKLPKVLHSVNGIPMIVRVINEAQKLNPYKIMLVVGQYKNLIMDTLYRFNVLKYVTFVIQKHAMGTGHAIQCAYSKLELLNNNHKILVLSGDTPLITSELMKNMVDFKDVKIMITERDDPSGYGRIKIENEKFEKIIEDKDCNEVELKINKVNCGIYGFKNQHLLNYLNLLDNKNKQNEYYLTDMIKIIKENANVDIELYNLVKEEQWQLTNVNDQNQLEYVNKLSKSL